MNNFALAGIAAAALAAVPALAIQQDSGPQPMTRAAVQARVQAHFAQADADNDGFITKAEAEARAAASREQRRVNRSERRAERFARLDANGDGSISRAEFDAPRQRGDRAERRENRSERRAERRGERRAMRGGMGGMRFGARAFDRLDTDRDGRISLADVSARALARFDRLDANRDGTVTREERRAMRERRQARPRG